MNASIQIGRRFGVQLLWLVLVLAGFCVLVPDFAGLRNMRGLILSVTLVGTIAPTMMLVLALREVDLSVGSITALAGGLTAGVVRRAGGGAPRDDGRLAPGAPGGVV